MATRNKASSVPSGTRKRSARSMEKAIRATDAKVHAAVHAVLRKEGLTGVKVHSVNFLVDRDAMTAPGCADCDLATHHCVLTPNGFVCLPGS
jgi:hypothetical protein